MRTSSLPLLVSLLILGACGTGERTASNAATGGTLVISVPGDAATFFPPQVYEATGADIRDQLYDRLADIGDDLNTIGDKGFKPQLADSWDWAKDSLSIAFHLDPRARWHDGQPVRANDVRFSFRIFTDTAVGSSVSPEISNIDSVSVRDSLTPVVWYKQKRPEQFYDFVYQIYIIPEHVLKDVPPAQLRTSDVPRKGIGSGRFRLVRWDPGRRIELVADTGNYRGRAKLDRVIWSVVPDASAALAQVLSGQGDLLELLPPDQAHVVDSSKTVRAVPYPNLQYGFLAFNEVDPKNPSKPHPLFGDRQLRRALSMALDRRAMLQNVFGSVGRPLYGPFPRSLAFADTTLQVLPYDTARAKALLDSLGWRQPAPGAVRQRNRQPLRFTLVTLVSSRPRMAYAVLVQEQLRRIGVQADIDQLQANAAFDRQVKRTFDAILVAQQTDPSPSGYVQQWGSKAAPPAGQNWASYHNPAYDALLDSALATGDPGRVRAYMRRAFQIQIDDAPAVWLYESPTVAAIQRRIHPAPMRADGWWAHLADWTIPPNERLPRDRIGVAATANQ
jgi:peptide/nickel transport system substrate-binding protein